MNEYSGVSLGLCYPHLFPHGVGCAVPKSKEADFFKHLMLYHDQRFASDAPLVMYLHSRVQRKHINSLVARVDQHTSSERFESLVMRANAASASEQDVRAVFKSMIPHSSVCRGSTPWLMKERQKVLAMVQSPYVRTLNVFLTLSSADYQWPQLHAALRSLGHPDAAKDFEDLTSAERSDLLRKHPTLAARLAHARFKIILDLIKQHPLETVGADTVEDWAIRYEWQMRGSVHAHAVLVVTVRKELEESWTAGITDEVERERIVLEHITQRARICGLTLPNPQDADGTRIVGSRLWSPEVSTGTSEGLMDLASLVGYEHHRYMRCPKYRYGGFSAITTILGR